MKKYYFPFLFFLLIGNALVAQVELKLNGYGFFYDIPYVSVEFFLNKNVGLEVGVGLLNKARGESIYDKKFMFFIVGKRYLFEHNENLYDNTYVGMYVSGQVEYRIFKHMFPANYKEPSFVVGGMIGRKWMYTKKIFMEGNLGLGLKNSKKTFEPNIFVFINDDEITRKWTTDIFLSFLVGYRF